MPGHCSVVADLVQKRHTLKLRISFFLFFQKNPESGKQSDCSEVFFGIVFSFVAASLRCRLENKFSNQEFSPHNLAILSLSVRFLWPAECPQESKLLPKAIKSKLIAGKNSQFTANVGNLAGCSSTCTKIAAKPVSGVRTLANIKK